MRGSQSGWTNRRRHRERRPTVGDGKVQTQISDLILAALGGELYAFPSRSDPRGQPSPHLLAHSRCHGVSWEDLGCREEENSE